jgi:diguanylate cyclase (GGDEF)-like protein
MRMPEELSRTGLSARRRLLSQTGIVALTLCLLVFLWSLTGWLTYIGRQDARLNAEAQARNLLLVIEHDITRNIELYDATLRSIGDAADDPQVEHLAPALRNRLIFGHIASGAYLDSVYVLNKHGDIVLDSRNVPARTGNFAHEDYFVYLSQHRSRSVYLSRPYASVLRNGALTVALARRIETPDGAFNGVVIGTLGVDYFHDLLDGLSIGQHGSAAVVRTDGILITRTPQIERMVGRDLSATPFFQYTLTHQAGTYAGLARLDGEHRLFVFKHLATLPLVIDVAPADRDIYEEWYRRSTRLVLLNLLLSAGIVAGTAQLVRELGRRQAAEIRLREFARTDALTRLSNRGAFDALLPRAWMQAQRSGQPLSVLFIDIDLFKRYNDHYGHQAGDEVLRAVGRALGLAARRSSDDVARYGGEEFVATLPNTTPENAGVIAESVRQAVASLEIEHCESPYGYVTVSIGYACSSDPGVDDAVALLGAADNALYGAKSRGRNRVCHASAASTAPAGA